MRERFKPVDKVRVVDIDDGDEQDELGERERHAVGMVGENAGQRPAKHVPHAYVEQWDEEYDRDDETSAHGGGGGLQLFGGRLHMGGAGPGLRTAAMGGVGARIDGRGRVTRAIDSGADVVGGDLCGVVVHQHRAGEQIDRDALDAVELAHGAVYVRLAGGARHATHIEFILSHGFSFLWLGIGIVNLPILYTHTPWGCPVQKEMYDISLQMRVVGWPMNRPNQSSQSVTSSRENDL